MSTHSFTAIGGYQFADTFKVECSDPIIAAQAGRLTGSFQLEFASGVILRTHVNGATANRVTESGASIFGTMQIDLGEAEGADPSGNLLFLSYSGDIELRGSVQIVRVSGDFVGGTDRYEGASGTFSATSINGFFDNGQGELRLAEGKELPHGSTAGIVSEGEDE